MEPLHHANHAISPVEVENHAKSEHQRLFQRGKTWLGAGLALMGLSFCITFVLCQSDTSFTTCMYATTSVGLLCIVKGLADIFGF